MSVRILIGDCRDKLRGLADAKIIFCIVRLRHRPAPPSGEGMGFAAAVNRMNAPYKDFK